MERITTLANRLAEAILFDWDKEEVFKLAKEVAVACHENIEFISLVRRMREAQKDEAAFESELDRKYRGNTWFMSTEEMMERQELCNKVFDLTTEVDEYLKKIE